MVYVNDLAKYALNYCESIFVGNMNSFLSVSYFEGTLCQDSTSFGSLSFVAGVLIKLS